MKRSKLRNFLFPSILFHLGLVAVIALAVVYFVEEREDKGEGTIIVGIVEGDQPAQRGEAADEPATPKKASTSRANDDTNKVEKIEPVKPVMRKDAPSLKKDTPNADKQPDEEHLTSTETDTNTQDLTEPNAKSVSDNTSGESKGIDTARADTSGKAAGAGLNSANNEKAFSSAYPDYDENPKPVYPTAARRRGYEGDVKLRVLVLENGKVGKIEIEKPSGYEVLDESALKTVNDWVFVPGKENGKEVSSWVTVPISFRLKSG